DADPSTGIPMTAEQMRDKAADADPAGAVEAMLKGKIDDALLAKVCALIKGEALDADPDKDENKEKDMVDKPAMDAAIAAAVDATEKKAKLALDEALKSVRDNERGIREALAVVRPWVGELAPELALD